MTRRVREESCPPDQEGLSQRNSGFVFQSIPKTVLQEATICRKVCGVAETE